MNFSGKILKKILGKKILIDIITRKIPRGVLATRACVSREPLKIHFETYLKKILTKKFGKKNWKKNWKKNFGKKIGKKFEKIWRKNFDKKIWKKKLEKKI